MSQTLGSRLRLLREALEWTQEDVSVRSVDDGGLVLRRIEVGQVEGGRNQASTKRVRAALARAFEVPEDDLFDYLEGRLALPEFLKRRSRARRGSRANPPEPKSPYEEAVDILVRDGYGSLVEVRRAAAEAKRELGEETSQALGVFEWAKRIELSLRLLRRREDEAGSSGVRARVGPTRTRQRRSG